MGDAEATPAGALGVLEQAEEVEEGDGGVCVLSEGELFVFEDCGGLVGELDGGGRHSEGVAYGLGPRRHIPFATDQRLSSRGAAEPLVCVVVVVVAVVWPLVGCDVDIVLASTGSAKSVMVGRRRRRRGERTEEQNAVEKTSRSGACDAEKAGI